MTRTLRQVFSGAKLRKLRWQRKMTIRELIERAGVSRAYLYALEAELEMQRGPSLDVIQRLATALDVSPDNLLDSSASDRKPGGSAIQQSWSRSQPSKIPAALRAAAKLYAIPSSDVSELVGFKFRSREPKTPADWHFLWQAILRSLSLPVNAKSE